MNKIFIEDIFLELFDTFEENGISFLKEDHSAVISFYNTLITQQQITQNQANYILRILEKYKMVSAAAGFDYIGSLSNPVWKNSFRIIDLAKKVFVEIDSDGCPWLCLKFPFQLKKEFETEILNPETAEGRDYGNIWDKDRKIRMLSLYEYNVMQLYDFVKKHNFEIDESFFEVIANVEEIWNSQDKIKKMSTIDGDRVSLINADEDSIAWFNANSQNNLTNDLLLAKNMGYTFAGEPANKAQKIAGAKSTTFFTTNYKDLFEITEQISGKVVILLDRTTNALEWLKTLSTFIYNFNLNRDDFKVCFRESNKEKPEFNDWVKQSGFGGRVSEGKYLIFQHKPAKWLFSNPNDVKMIITNNVYPSTNPITKHWLQSHPCVVYLEEVKQIGWSKNIVKL